MSLSVFLPLCKTGKLNPMVPAVMLAYAQISTNSSTPADLESSLIHTKAKVRVILAVGHMLCTDCSKINKR